MVLKLMQRFWSLKSRNVTNVFTPHLYYCWECSGLKNLFKKIIIDNLIGKQWKKTACVSKTFHPKLFLKHTCSRIPARKEQVLTQKHLGKKLHIDLSEMKES